MNFQENGYEISQKVRTTVTKYLLYFAVSNKCQKISELIIELKNSEY